MKTDNEFIVLSGQNLPNHTASLQGLGKFVTFGTGVVPIIRTRDALFRMIAHMINKAEQIDLPPESQGEGVDPYTLDDYIDAICDGVGKESID